MCAFTIIAFIGTGFKMNKSFQTLHISVMYNPKFYRIGKIPTLFVAMGLSEEPSTECFD